MKFFKKRCWSYLFGSVITSFAFIVATLNINTTCAWIAHQPKIPDVAKKLRKF